MGLLIPAFNSFLNNKKLKIYIISMSVTFGMIISIIYSLYAFNNTFSEKIQNSKLFQNPKKIEMIMLILFLIPGTPKDLLVYIAGLLPIKPLRFILISTFGRIPSVISSTLAGANIAVGDWKMGVVLYGIVILIAIIVIFLYQKFDKEGTAQEALKTIK